MPSRTVVYNDLDAFTGSDALPYDGAEQLPLTTRQFVGLGTTSTGASYRQTIMCKMKSWDPLETYYPGSAAPGSSCSTINQASYALVLEGLAEGEVPVVTELVFDEWESFAGSQWTSQSLRPAASQFRRTCGRSPF